MAALGGEKETPLAGYCLMLGLAHRITKANSSLKHALQMPSDIIDKEFLLIMNPTKKYARHHDMPKKLRN